MNEYTPTTRLSIERIERTWHTAMHIVLGNGEQIDFNLQLPLQENPSPTLAQLNRQVLERARVIIDHMLSEKALR
jgi:hypothetical protein